MPVFFIPAAKDADNAEVIWRSVRDHIGLELGGVTDTRIFSISFSHNGEHMKATVGEVFAAVREPVIAILESASSPLIYVCTPTRGVIRGMPYLVGREGAVVRLFDAEEPSGS